MNEYSKLLKQEAFTNQKIFWDVKDINNLSDKSIVERILLYGNMQQFRNIVKNLTEFEKIYNQIKSGRNSLTPIVKNYVDKYVKYYS